MKRLLQEHRMERNRSGLEAGPGGARGMECLQGKGLGVCDFGFGFKRGYAELAA
jgi:hypothetical protein